MIAGATFIAAPAASNADVIYSVADQLVDLSFNLAKVSGTIWINPATGLVDRADLTVDSLTVGTFHLNNLTDRFIDIANNGADIPVEDSSNNELILDIITGTSNGTFPPTFAGGDVLAGIDTFFKIIANNDTFTGFAAGTVTGPELSPPVSVPGPIVGAGSPGLMLVVSGFIARWRRKRHVVSRLVDFATSDRGTSRSPHAREL